MSIRQLTAFAYFLIVSIDGECMPDSRLFSKRTIAGAFVPMRRAISAWVSPARWRARSILFKREYSGRRLSYDERTARLVKALRRSSSWFIRMYLLQSFPGCSQFFFRRFIAFLDEHVKHDDALPAFCTIEHPAYAFFAFQTDFKKLITHCTGMRHSKIGAKLHHKVSDMNIARQKAGRHFQYHPGYFVAELFNFPNHAVNNITHLLYCFKKFIELAKAPR